MKYEVQQIFVRCLFRHKGRTAFTTNSTPLLYMKIYNLWSRQLSSCFGDTEHF